MKKIILPIIIICSFVITKAQETTTGKPIITPKSKFNVLIIPFESKMYISDIDRDLAQKNNMNFQEIKAKFRAALDREIFISLKQYYNPLSFYTIDQNQATKELTYIYNSIGYKYEVVPTEEVVKKKNPAEKLLNKFKKKKKEPIKAGIQNGEVVSQVDNREKYMKTILSNTNLLPNLNKRYHASNYIFINELDIRKSADDVYAASEEQYKREIKVHYTIFNANGKEVSSGAIKTRFNSGQNDVNKIIKVQFPLIAQRIVEKLAEGSTVLKTKKNQENNTQKHNLH